MATFKWDKEQKKVVEVDETVEQIVDNQPTVIFKGGGWPSQKIAMDKKRQAGLQKDVLYNTMEEHETRMKKLGVKRG